MSGHQERFDEALNKIGILGVTDLVERWTEHSRQFRTATLEWDSWLLSFESDLRTWKARHGADHFRIDGLHDDARLYYVWHEWGERALGDGPVDRLMVMARELIRRGGPFGGPTPVEGIRAAHKTSEVRLERALHGVFALSRVDHDGRFAFRLVNRVEQRDQALPGVNQAEPLTLAIAGIRVPWCFADCSPILGYIHAPPHELLLCVCDVETVGVLGLSEATLAGTHFTSPTALTEFDAGRWLDSLPKPRRPASTTAAPGTPTASVPEVTPAAHVPKATPDAGVREAAAAAPEPPAEPPAQPPAKPRPAAPRRPAGGLENRPKRERPLADLVRRHFAHVAAQIPAGVLGAATAQELWTALEQGYRRDLPAISGSRTELFTGLYAAGLLKSMPGEHTGRAALQILAGLSPIVRKIHHRRWSLMFPELRRETSDVIRAIRVQEEGAGD
jgi:hypothetical protein